VVAHRGSVITVHRAARTVVAAQFPRFFPEHIHMKQRTTLLSRAVVGALLCGAFATPLAFAQTHKHHKSTTTSTQSTTTTDTGAATDTTNATGTTSTGTDTTATGSMSSDMSAQSTPPYSATPATPASPANPATGTPATPATPAYPADASAASMGNSPTTTKQMNWSDLDADHNGSLSKSEASTLNSLSQVFDTADGNKDGSLTADEYRAYLKSQGK